jgi:protein involved in polysaccharide export with SLBB domain
LRGVQATGRVVLDIPARNSQISDLPDIALEDGDRFLVPSKPSTSNVMGMVYNENAFVYQPKWHVSDYLAKAGGPTRDADESRIYLLRADGSVLSAQSSKSMFDSFSNETLMPGDTIVVPEMLDKFSMTRELKDWAQIFYQFALGVGGIKLLRL